MDSVKNFLAENYIWFFVAAVVLLFALIGFIIDAKKKKKSEFKGEAIQSDNQMNAGTIPNQVPNQMPNATPNNDVQVIGNTVDMGGQATLGTANASMQVEPLGQNNMSQPEQPIEFYAGNVNMPPVSEAPTNTMNQSFGTPISNQPVNTNQNVAQDYSNFNNNSYYNNNLNGVNDISNMNNINNNNTLQ